MNFGRCQNGTTETTSYDAANNKISETDRAGRTTKYVYDAANRLTEIVYPDDTPLDDNDNPRTHSQYDGTGRLIRRIDARGNATQYQYDAAGRNTHVTDALGHTTEYQYDALSRNTGQTDQAGRTTQYEYDAVGNLIAVIDPLGQRTEYSYDERGNKISQIDAGGRTTTWAYDNLDRQTSRTLPEGQTKTFTYDTNGNKLSHTNFNGNTTTYAYEADTHRLSTVTDSDGTTRYTYSPTGRIETVTDQNGTVSYQYDTRYRLIQQIQADGAVLAYTYDANGNTTTVSVTRGGQTFVTQHTYDELNRLVSTTDHNGNLTAYYTYDAVGNRETVNYPNGTWSYYRYNERNQLTELRHTDALDNLVERYSYSLDPTGRRSRITENSGRVTDYVYDDLYRLTGETVTDPVNGNYSASYQYDATGNRTGETVNGIHTAYTYDNNDRLLQQGGIVYTYDDNGNTLSETLNGNTVTYSYDAGNRLTQVTQGGVTTAYTYNHNGIRISKTEGGITTDYIVDENRDYAQVLIETTPAEQVIYTYGDDLISQDRNGVLSLYHYDGLGSTRFLSDAGGAVTDWYDYVAFGEVLNQTGGTENLYLFAGEQFDASLGQYYLRARYYNQGIGRFTQMDAWMGSPHDPITLHKYLYANADPVGHVDPSGNIALARVGIALQTMGSLISTAYRTYGVVDRVLEGFFFIQSLYSAFNVIAGSNNIMGMFDRYESETKKDPKFAWVLSSDGRSQAQDAFKKNAFRVLWNIMKFKRGIITSAIYEQDRTFLVYLPTPEENVFGGGINLKTGIKVPMPKGSPKPIELVFGTGGGRVFGLGIGKRGKARNNNQLMRMDWHAEHDPTLRDCIPRWFSGKFHFHIQSPSK